MEVEMRPRRSSLAILVFLAVGVLAVPAQGVTLALNFSGGSLVDPITDSSVVDLDSGDAIFLYSSATVLDADDLFSEIFAPQPGGGLDWNDPSSVVLSSSIGSGISPPVNLEGRVRGQLDLGNTDSPLRSEGTWLLLIAIDAADLASATEAGISADAFGIPSLPDPNDAPPLPVDFSYGGFATAPIPEPGTFALVSVGLLGLHMLGHRSRQRRD